MDMEALFSGVSLLAFLQKLFMLSDIDSFIYPGNNLRKRAGAHGGCADGGGGWGAWQHAQHLQ